MPKAHESLTDIRRPIWSVLCNDTLVKEHQTYSRAFQIAQATQAREKSAATVITDAAAERFSR